MGAGIDNLSLSRLLRDAKTHPMLTREEEHGLATRARDGDRDAVARLVGSHLRLIIKIANRYRNTGLSLPDLVQEGSIGLLQALRRFNPDRDARLSTYSMWWIKAAIQDHVMRSWSIVRIRTGAAQKSLYFNLRRMRAALNETGEALSDAAVRTLATRFSLSEAEVRGLDQRLAGRDQSLDDHGPGAGAGDTDDKPTRWIDRLRDEAPNPEQLLIVRDELRYRLRLLTGALAHLNKRERLIVRRRHLVEVAQTLESLGRELGISKERVRQIEGRAMEKLRALMLPGIEPDGAYDGAY